MGSCSPEVDEGAGVGPQSGCQRGKEAKISTERGISNAKRRELLRRASICPCADTHPDACPNQLTPMRDCLNLVDGGVAINSPFPLSLLPQRAVDLIVSFDYSLDTPFEVRGGGSLLRRPDWVCGDGPSRRFWVLICQWRPVLPEQHWSPGWAGGEDC